LAINISLTPGP
jgi:hypothetical protein